MYTTACWARGSWRTGRGVCARTLTCELVSAVPTKHAPDCCFEPVIGNGTILCIERKAPSQQPHSALG